MVRRSMRHGRAQPHDTRSSASCSLGGKVRVEDQVTPPLDSFGGAGGGGGASSAALLRQPLLSCLTPPLLVIFPRL